MDPFTIGKLARKADVNVETIRYYERSGVLAPPPRTRGGRPPSSCPGAFSPVHRLLFTLPSLTLYFALLCTALLPAPRSF